LLPKERTVEIKGDELAGACSGDNLGIFAYAGVIEQQRGGGSGKWNLPEPFTLCLA
jgi:hypothetical protein